MKKFAYVTLAILVSAGLASCANTPPPVTVATQPPQSEQDDFLKATAEKQERYDTMESDLKRANLDIARYLVTDVTSKDLSVVELTAPTYDTSNIVVVGAWNDYTITITDTESDKTFVLNSQTGRVTEK